MLNTNNADNRLSALSFIGRILMLGRTLDSEGVSSIEAVDNVYPSGALPGPIVEIYRATFLSGTQREILVLGNPDDHDFESTVYLKPGRIGDKLSEIRRLIIRGVHGKVPESVKECLRRYNMGRGNSPRLCA